MTRKILTPCPPKDECPICLSRINEELGNGMSKAGKFLHMAAQWGTTAIEAILHGDAVSAANAAQRAATYAHKAELEGI